MHDPDSLVAHQPDVEGLREVWVEGDARLSKLLAGLDVSKCDLLTPATITQENVVLCVVVSSWSRATHLVPKSLPE